CVAVMELARALATGKRPKRTVYFICFGSEERGGLGSRYFVANLPIPLENVIADIPSRCWVDQIRTFRRILSGSPGTNVRHSVLNLLATEHCSWQIHIPSSTSSNAQITTRWRCAVLWRIQFPVLGCMLTTIVPVTTCPKSILLS